MADIPPVVSVAQAKRRQLVPVSMEVDADLIDIWATECTCLLGRIDEHKRGECTCTTPVMDCAVHADSDIGRSAAETVIASGWAHKTVTGDRS